MKNGQGGSHLCDVSWLFSEWSCRQPGALTPLNPLAMGNLVNHPPRHVAPNAAFHSIDVPCDVMGDASLRWFVPCVRYLSANQKSEVMGGGGRAAAALPALGIVSTRDFAEGEEVFCNYNFDVDSAPEWYAEVK
jgi:hypothetical protein